jgi:hypothetical protein
MGASLTMIDRHYGHLARDEHAIQLLDERMAANVHGGRWVDVTRAGRRQHRQRKRQLSREETEAL